MTESRHFKISTDDERLERLYTLMSQLDSLLSTSDSGDSKGVSLLSSSDTRGTERLLFYLNSLREPHRPVSASSSSFSKIPPTALPTAILRPSWGSQPTRSRGFSSEIRHGLKRRLASLSGPRGWGLSLDSILLTMCCLWLLALATLAGLLLAWSL